MAMGRWGKRPGVVGTFALLAVVLLVPSAADPAAVRGGATMGAHGPTGSFAAAPPARSRPAVEHVVFNAASGRHELVVPDPSSIAVLIGDSQADGAASVPGKQTWPQVALGAAGYTVTFRGRGGTGYATGNGRDPDYVTALRQERWLLPHGDVGLVVIEGGGNDARTGASDAVIASSQAALLAELRRSYPHAPMVVVGTLARSAGDGGGRRHQVDDLVGRTARAQGVAFISVGDWLTVHDLARHLADQVHLDAMGHRLAAGFLLQAMQSAGLDRQAGHGRTRHTVSMALPPGR